MKHSVTTLSIISVILLVFIEPLIGIYRPDNILPIPVRIFYGVSGFVLNLGLALWMFRLGLSIGTRCKTKISKALKYGLIILAIALFANHYYTVAIIDRMQFYSELSDKLFGLSMPLLWRVCSLGLYNSMYLIFGMLSCNIETKLSGRIFDYGWISMSVLLLFYCVGEVLYFNEKGLSALFFAFAVIPMVISILSIYKWSCSEKAIALLEKYSRSSRFLAFLYPSAIIVFMLGGYLRVALFYLIVMWLIYRWRSKVKREVYEK